MGKIRTVLRKKLRQASYISIAVVLGAVGVFSGWVDQHASAAPLNSRFIRMGRSAPNATTVAYMVGFTIPVSVNVGGLAIDFCDNSPLIGETCDAPAGFNTNFGTLSINNQSGITDFTVDSGTSSINTVILNRTAAASSGAVTFELGNGTTNGFTNQSATGTFYARIYTYTTAAAADTHDQDNATGYTDSGGIALSTAAIINITARVQETLSFCVFPDDDGGGAGTGTCGDAPNVTIGHDNGAGTLIIDPTVVDTTLVKFSLSTNANGGAVVRMKGDTLKDVIGNDINAAGAAAAMVAGTEEFGLRISSLGSMTATAPYNGGAGAYGLIVTGGGADDATATFGANIASTNAPVNNSVTTIEFAATASNTTAAGVYTAAQQLIATGTF